MRGEDKDMLDLICIGKHDDFNTEGMRDNKLGEKEESGFEREERYVRFSRFALMKMETNSFFFH